MRTLKEVGRYAVGIEWADGHESILPYRDLREHCPCATCAGAAQDLPPAASQATDLQRIILVTRHCSSAGPTVTRPFW